MAENKYIPNKIKELEILSDSAGAYLIAEQDGKAKRIPADGLNGVKGAILYSTQQLTDEQKAQARANIDAVGAEYTTKSTTYVNEYGTGDVTASVEGYVNSDGVLEATASWRSTDYIAVVGKCHIAGVFINRSNIAAAAFYDSSHIFISSVHDESDELNYNFTVDIDVPETAAFVRFSFYGEDGSQYATLTSTSRAVYLTEDEAVTLSEQSLSEAEQETVRSKIGAAKQNTELLRTVYSHPDNADGDVKLEIPGRINLSGEYEETSVFCCSDYIPLGASTEIYINEASEADTGLTVSFYDENKTFISGLGGNTNWNQLAGTTVVPPTGSAYVRLCIYAVDTAAKMTIASVVTVDDFIAVDELDYDTIVKCAADNAYIDTSGAQTATAAWVISDFIRVNPSFEIDCLLYSTASTLLLAFYDRNREFVSGISNTEEGLHEATGITPPDNAYYVRYAAFLNQTDQYVRIRYKKLETLFSECERSLDENPLRGKILSATGDSITAAASYRPYAGYARMIAKRNGMIYDDAAVWGATLASGIEGSAGCILDSLSSMREDADYIILSGGANDFYAISDSREQLGEISDGYSAALDTSTLCGALESLCKSAINKWAGKKILYVITHRMLDISDTQLESYVAAMRDILEKWGIPYVDLWHDMPSLYMDALKDLYTTMGNTAYNGTGDGLHPNEEGYRRYYVPRIEAKLKSI